MAGVFSARNMYRYMQRQAHESPVIFYSCLIGAAGPVIMVTVPPIRKSLGYQPTPHIPTSYPLPQRARVPVQGYEDE